MEGRKFPSLRYNLTILESLIMANQRPGVNKSEYHKKGGAEVKDQEAGLCTGWRATIRIPRQGGTA